MDTDRFIQTRPVLYHLTARENLPRIERLARLETSSELLAATNRPELRRTRRTELTPINVGDERVILRDQAPLHAGNCKLAPGFTFEDLVEMLNRFVYFWPGREDKPISYGQRHFARYASGDNVVITIQTRDLFDANPSLTPHFSTYNSGSPRCSAGNKSPRGPDTFKPASRLAATPGKVVEVAFPAAVQLPPSRWSATPVSNWT